MAQPLSYGGVWTVPFTTTTFTHARHNSQSKLSVTTSRSQSICFNTAAFDCLTVSVTEPFRLSMPCLNSMVSNLGTRFLALCFWESSYNGQNLVRHICKKD